VETMETLKVGDKATVDTFGGLLACKVLAIRSSTAFEHGAVAPSTSVTVRVMLTGRSAERHGFVRGEAFDIASIHVMPRTCVARRKYCTRIHPYMVEVPR